MKKYNVLAGVLLAAVVGLSACGDDASGGGLGGDGDRTCTIDGDCTGESVCTDGVCTSDLDVDGIADPIDNCPNVANPDQLDDDLDGMGDACDDDDDGDGIGDLQDNCPLTPNPDQIDGDGDNVGDACDDDEQDTDSDGVPDSQDNCPNVPNPDQADADADGTGDACDPDVDRDQDGVPDTSDNCPDTPNAGQQDADGDGIGDACDSDRDGDGTDNDADNCPDTPNDQSDIDGDSIGDLCDDGDGDGFIDVDDNCPHVANPGQQDIDGDSIGDVCDPDRDGDGVRDDGDGSGTIGDNPCDDAQTTGCDDNCTSTPNAGQSDNDQDGLGDVCDPDNTRLDGQPYDDQCSFDFTANGFDPSVEWSFTIPAGAPYDSRDQVMMTPAVANLNDDNADGVVDTSDIPDIIFSSFGTSNTVGNWDWLGAGVLRAISGDGSGLLWSVGYTELGLTAAGGVQPAGSIAVADLDDDGTVEIIAQLVEPAAATDGLVVVGHDGLIEWQTSGTTAGGVDQPTHVWGGPAVADLTGDGSPEIVVGDAVFDNTGNLLWDGSAMTAVTGPGEGNNWQIGSLSAVADLDQDGDQEIVTGRTAYHHDGSTLWHLSDAAMTDGFVAVADFDADGSPEVAVVAENTVRIHAGASGALVWGPIAVPDGGRLGAPTVADFNGDGTREIGIAGWKKYVALDVDLHNPPSTYTAAMIWENTTQDASSNTTGSSVFDFQGDGTAEVVYNDEVFLRVYDGATGAVLFEEPNSSFTALEYPLIVDVDNDGAAEIVVGSNDFECGDQLDCGTTGGRHGITVFGDASDNWVATRRIWNQHTYHIGNIEEDGTVPLAETPSWAGHNTYRLNALTEIPPQAAPDLLGENPNLEHDETCDVTAKVWVTNAGAVRVGAGLPVSIYVDDGTGRVFVAEGRTRFALEPGESERVDVQLTLPSRGTSYDVIAVVDDAGGTGQSTENECDEANNAVVVVQGATC